MAFPQGGNFQDILSGTEIPFYEITFERLKKPVEIWGNCLWLATFPITVFQVCRIIRREHIDVVHLNGLMALQGGIAAFLCRRKIVWHLSSCLYPQKLVKTVMRLVKAIAHRMVIISEGIREYHFGENAVADERIVVIQEGVNTTALSREAVSNLDAQRMRERLGLTTTDRVVGSVGNVNPLKGYEDFLHAASAIALEYPDIKYVIAGALFDSQREYIAKLEGLAEKLQIAERLIFADSMVAEDIPALLSLFDVFIMTSHTEGGPRVTLEAMSMELPVIATTVGDVPYQIADGRDGFVVEVGDWRKMAKRGINLLAAPELAAEIGTQARLKVVAQFDESVMIAKHLQVYESLLPQQQQE